MRNPAAERSASPWPYRWPWLAVLLALPMLWLVDLGALWSNAVSWVLATQRELHDALAASLQAVAESGQSAIGGLALLGFLYGVFHAAGPGHGKVVITTYLTTQRESLGRGIILAVVSAFLQGLVAIGAVFGTVLVLEQSARQSQVAAGWLETASYGLVAILGLLLLWRHGKRLLLSPKNSSCGHGHCGHHHHHAPPADRAFLAGLLSIGLRPCTGAILVLVLAMALDLRLAGVAAVLAMSAGTALTVAGLASVAVFAREQAARLGHWLDGDALWLARVGDIVAVVGGLVLLALGASLLHANLVMPAHPLLRG